MPTTVTVEITVDMDVPKEVFVDWIRSQVDVKTLSNDICGWPKSMEFVDALDDYEGGMQVRQVQELVAISCSSLEEGTVSTYRFRPVQHLAGAYVRDEYRKRDVAYVREFDAFLVSGVLLRCPRCKERFDGYHEDPRGKVIECPHCTGKFTVSLSAQIDFY